MATLVFTAIGTLIGGPLGGAIGAMAGRQVDAQLLGGGGNREGPRLSELTVTTSSYGIPMPRLFGRMRVAGQIVWATDLVEHSERHGNGKGRPSTTQYTYTASFAVALSSRPIQSVGRIWADGKLLRGAAGDLKTGGTFRLHRGDGDQPVDPLLSAAEDPGQCPAYTGLAYAVFEDLQLGDFGNRIPALTFEVIADRSTLSIATLLDGVIDAVDADVALDGVDGLSCDGPVGDMLAALDAVFPVDCDACDAALAIRPDRNQAAPIALPEAATSTDREDFGGNAGFACQRGAQAEASIAVLRYYDVDRDYQPGAQRATGRPLPGQPRTMELPAALTANGARRLIDQAVKRAQWARQTMSWRVTQIDPEVRPGATVTLPAHPGVWRVRDWEWRAHGVDLTLVRLSPAQGHGGTSDPGRVSPAADLPLAPTALAACEVPWDGNPASPSPMLIAAVSSPQPSWSGASLYVDQGDGALLPLGVSGRARAIIGTADTVLAPRSPLLFDRHGSVTVTLAGADLPLANATMRQLAMGANRAVLGSEIIQFAHAQPLGEGRWILSGLLRGRVGTEGAVGLHCVGETFILLDGTGTVLPPETVGTVPGAIIAAIGLGDAGPVTAPVALRGIGLRPPSPVHGRARTLADGSLRLDWVRRARGGWLWQDAVETPLNERSEAWEIVYSGSGPQVARWEQSGPSFTLGAGEYATLRQTSPDGQFAVRQRGDHALSDPLFIVPQ